MLLVHTVAELRSAVADWRKAGQRIAFVPTMGNLHRGHLELVRKAREKSDRVVASVFVNPLQFGPNEDFDKYPRTLEHDKAGLIEARCDLLFAPNAKEIYPNGMGGLSTISVPGISDILCGHFRPGHFDGVATVVNILFNLVQPDVALFGEKDCQQLLVIRRMTADLRLPIEIVCVATEREADGLALSSRNQYLSAAERQQAPVLHQTLLAAAASLKQGRRDYAAIQAEAIAQIEKQGFKPQYFEVRSSDLSVPTAQTREWVLLAAAYLGPTRLIDNVKITV